MALRNSESGIKLEITSEDENFCIDSDDPVTSILQLELACVKEEHASNGDHEDSCDYLEVEETELNGFVRAVQKRFTKCSSTSTTRVKRYICEICNYKTDSTGNLTVHVRTHTGEKPFSCDYCDYRTARSKDLVSHVRRHTGEKPFACEACNYTTGHKVNFIRHVRTHSGEKPYICEFCDYRTGDPSALLSHAKVHSVQKPFACSICDYRARRRAHLSRHMLMHTGQYIMLPHQRRRYFQFLSFCFTTKILLRFGIKILTVNGLQGRWIRFQMKKKKKIDP
uniref:RE1-silencing transcription factor n=1 Tax=Lygus hesperus TaxID=30085 RepID=A0A0A9YV75_LYGHE